MPQANAIPNPFQKTAYISSQFSDNIEQNLKKTSDYCEFTTKYNYVPVSPQLIFSGFMNAENDKLTISQMSETLMSRCDELWVFVENYIISEEMRTEISKAMELKMPINYFVKLEKDDSDEYEPSIKLHKRSEIDKSMKYKIYHRWQQTI